MDIFALALKLTTSGQAEMNGALDDVKDKGHDAAGTLNDELASGIDHVIERMAEMISIWEAGHLFKEMISDAAELAVTLRRTEQMTGITAERLAELGEAAELNYMPVEQLNTGFRRLSMSMTDANSKGARAFKALGLNIEDFHGDADAALTALSKKISQYGDGMQKAAILNDIFGRGGAQWAPLLNNLEETDKKVKGLGQTMTNEQQQSMLKYEQAMIQLKITTDGFSRQVAAAAAGPLAELAKAFTVTIRDGEEFNVLAEIVTGTIRFLGTVVIMLKTAFLAVGHAIGNMAAMIVDSIPVLKNFADVAVDVLTQNWAKMAVDIKKTSFDKIKGDFAQLNYDLLADGMKQAEELKKLYGFGPEEKGQPGKKGKAAPNVSDGKEDETWKYNLKRIQDQVEAEKVLYELEIKRIMDSYGMEKDKYEKIAALDQTHLEEVIDLYGEGSKEYYDQLKLQEEHHKHHLDAMLKEENDYAKNVKEIDDMLRGWEEEGNRQKLEKSKQFANVATSSIEAIFKAGFAKGGTIGSSMKAFADTVLAGIGGMMVRLGETYLTYGSIMTALAGLLPNPFTAGPAGIAIGLALVALGSALGAIGQGGGGGGSASSAYSGAPPASFPTVISFGQNSATSAAGMTPVAPVSLTVIGPNDPKAQRDIVALITNAQRRNIG